jgi:hypothetical protein
MTPHDVRRLVDSGMTYQTVADLAQRSKSWVAKHVKFDAAKTRFSPKTERKCLCCGGKFKSDGPSNRMCCACRRKAENLSPFAIYQE